MKHIHTSLIRSLILIGGVLLFALQTQAQKAETKLSFSIRNATLEEFVKRIENSTGFSFIYGEEVKMNHRLTLDVKQKTIPEILDLAFANEPVKYQITGRHILLQKKKQKPVSRKFTISGYVTDGTSSETLIGANILESRQQQGTTTNPYGFYSITLPAGETELSFSYLGYTTRQYRLELSKDTLINVLMQDNNQLEEVVIVSDKAEAGITATQMGAQEIPIAQIKNTPSILGEADVMKTIQLMPGVQAGVEGSAGLYVRGGGPDQNLILLDGVPVYNVDHLFGFFSVFTPEAVKKVTLFKSSFPARFGGRLSSVVDVRSNDGDMKKYHGTLSVGLLSSKIQLEGPIIRDKTSFNISARRSYIDLIAKPFMPKDDKISYYFYDINAKINHKFSDRSRLFLNFYNGKDSYYFKTTDSSSSMYKDKMSLNWGNTIATARWNYIFNQKLFSNTTVAYNKYRMDANSTVYTKTNLIESISESNYHSNYHSGICDWSYLIDFDYNPTPAHHIKFGAGYLHHDFRPEVATSKIQEKEDGITKQDTLYNSISNSTIQAHEVSAYIEDNFDIGSRLRMNVGLHLSMFRVQRRNYFSVQPRVSARYQLTKHTALKASYTKMSQYIHLLSSTPISMPTDLWVPVTSKIKPMQAHQYSLGSYYTGLPGWEFSVEGYYKQMRNVLEYKEGVSFLGSSSGWENKVEMGKGRSMGIEFMAQKTTGKTTGWIAYTLAKSDRKFAIGGINNGERFPYKYDRRHNLSLVVNHKFSNRIDIGASWIFSTGGTATIAEEVTAIIRPGEDAIQQKDYIEKRNNYRLPASHRLNIGVNFNKKTKHGVRTWNISLYNAYNAMNPTMIYSNNSGGYASYIKNQEDGKVYLQYIPAKRKITKLTLLPCVPSVTYTYKF
ncbi:TonB-dependent receptor [Bacteroides nordii]|uniref:TonB-dependent receptor n=1 Tax=Bacteroides nordii TaxID=291645 RepID=A0A413VJN6_9BACE|nr:TonB-dependent receptor [Bacteroides nordii]RHB33796.1 TonB-dependent receptor [Bacteroides nordii]